jgi:hypothetical protein
MSHLHIVNVNKVSLFAFWMKIVRCIDRGVKCQTQVQVDGDAESMAAPSERAKRIMTCPHTLDMIDFLVDRIKASNTVTVHKYLFYFYFGDQ